MNHHDVARHSSRERSLVQSGVLDVGFKRNSFSEISTRNEIGDLRVITSKQCGGCFSRTKQRISWIVTGSSYSIREFVELAFDCVELDWRRYGESGPRYFRPAEVDHLRGDSFKARERLGWSPSVTLPELVKMMVDADLRIAREERALMLSREDR
jgi:hypothetical protein